MGRPFVLRCRVTVFPSWEIRAFSPSAQSGAASPAMFPVNSAASGAVCPFPRFSVTLKFLVSGAAHCSAHICHVMVVVNVASGGASFSGVTRNAILAFPLYP